MNIPVKNQKVVTYKKKDEKGLIIKIEVLTDVGKSCPPVNTFIPAFVAKKNSH